MKKTPKALTSPGTMTAVSVSFHSSLVMRM
jgi:hypothetical protein